jgi:hypothetical protein
MHSLRSPSNASCFLLGDIVSDTTRALVVNFLPVPVTFGFFQGATLADLSSAEEKVVQAMVTCVYAFDFQAQQSTTPPLCHFVFKQVPH